LHVFWGWWQTFRTFEILRKATQQWINIRLLYLLIYRLINWVYTFWGTLYIICA
jgi:hypothetical protein